MLLDRVWDALRPDRTIDAESTARELDRLLGDHQHAVDDPVRAAAVTARAAVDIYQHPLGQLSAPEVLVAAAGGNVSDRARLVLLASEISRLRTTRATGYRWQHRRSPTWPNTSRQSTPQSRCDSASSRQMSPASGQRCFETQEHVRSLGRSRRLRWRATAGTSPPAATASLPMPAGPRRSSKAVSPDFTRTRRIGCTRVGRSRCGTPSPARSREPASCPHPPGLQHPIHDYEPWRGPCLTDQSPRAPAGLYCRRGVTAAGDAALIRRWLCGPSPQVLEWRRRSCLWLVARSQLAGRTVARAATAGSQHVVHVVLGTTRRRHGEGFP